MRPFISTTLLALTAFVSPSMAWAHPGHGGDPGLIAGMLHPFTGVDHLLAVLAAGLLLGWLPRRTRGLTCAGFLGLLGATHASWPSAATSEAFMVGLLLTSAGLIAAGMAATKLVVTAAAGRSRI